MPEDVVRDVLSQLEEKRQARRVGEEFARVEKKKEAE
jgi:hypothetical protein